MRWGRKAKDLHFKAAWPPEKTKMEERKMTSRMKIALSMAVILVAIAASLGATFAWFTDEAEAENVFTAGTVTIDVDEQWSHGQELVNWNPGDCTPKLISVEYTGSKRAFLRVKIEQGWVDSELSDDNVSWLIYIGDLDIEDYIDKTDPDKWKWDYPKGVDGYGSFKEWTEDEEEWRVFDLDDDDDWYFYEGWYYYRGGSDTEYTYMLGTEVINAITEGDDVWNNKIFLVSSVCLDGLSTDNKYQGKTYTMKFTFQAIQASHSDQWDWDDFEDYN